MERLTVLGTGAANALRYYNTCFMLHGPQGGLDGAGLVPLQIVIGYTVFPAYLVVSGCAEGLGRVASHPGALNDADAGKTVGLEVLHTAGQYAGMGGSALLGPAGRHQVGLQGHAAAPGDPVGDMGRLHQGHGHGVGVAAVDLVYGCHFALLSRRDFPQYTRHPAGIQMDRAGGQCKIDKESP